MARTHVQGNLSFRKIFRLAHLCSTMTDHVDTWKTKRKRIISYDFRDGVRSGLSNPVNQMVLKSVPILKLIREYESPLIRWNLSTTHLCFHKDLH
jgi:hypothetical protein